MTMLTNTSTHSAYTTIKPAEGDEDDDVLGVYVGFTGLLLQTQIKSNQIVFDGD
jgi:hypothetical protein